MGDTYTPQRTQYPFADANVRYKSRGEILRMQEQWNTFERVENYNDIVYQKFQQGLFGNLYYQFVNNDEFRNYTAGQQLHVVTYPKLPASTFNPIRNRPMPDVKPVQAPPYETNVPRFSINRITPSASEQAGVQADLEIYTYVSTFNRTHVLQFNFVSDEDRLAYERTEQRLNAPASLRPSVN